jgi:hypothetical protein
MVHLGAQKRVHLNAKHQRKRVHLGAQKRVHQDERHLLKNNLVVQIKARLLLEDLPKITSVPKLNAYQQNLLDDIIRTNNKSKDEFSFLEKSLNGSWVYRK